MKNPEIKIIAGPCSISHRNVEEIYEIAKIKTHGKRAIHGTRIVGLKSRTALNRSGEGMGIDYEAVIRNFDKLRTEGITKDFEPLPSIEIMKKVTEKTGLLVATEIMMPAVQIPSYQEELKNEKLLFWNPSVNQLGWSIYQTSEFSRQNTNWQIGIKNPKWVGEKTELANSEAYHEKTSAEKTWEGLVKYSQAQSNILIHRGFDVPQKAMMRNLPLHNLAKRVKRKTECPLYFDPSHAFGPTMRSQILTRTLSAMKIMSSSDEYLYDGILIEVGTSETDAEQHITINELKTLVDELSKFRILK